MTVYAKPEYLNLEVAGKTRNTYIYDAPAEHSIAQIQSPEYFGRAMKSNVLTPRDLIEVIPRDNSYMMRLMVREQIRQAGQCVTVTIGQVQHFDVEMDLPGDYRVEFAGGAEGHVIWNKNVRIESGFSSQEGAVVRVLALFEKEQSSAALRKAQAKVSAAPRRARKKESTEA